MASSLVLSVLAPAVLARLKNYAPLTALVPATRIVDDVRTGMLYPFVLVEVGSELPFNTLGDSTDLKYGSEATVQVRVISQYRGDAEAINVMDKIKAALDGYEFTLPGYPEPALMTFESSPPMLKDTVAGVTTRELVAEFAATVHQ